MTVSTVSTAADITLTVNNKLMTVPAGTSVIQATIDAGAAVPHFCWHPGLSVAGVCRFCMVKIEGMPKLQIACNTIVSEGMKVSTVSDDVKEAHKWALEFHLINHPLDCPICDQAGECELQNYYMKVGKYTSQMDEEKVLKPKIIDVGDTLVLDAERCILCSRCVRFEDEVTKTGTLGIYNRGDKSVIGTVQNRKIKHNYSYNLADICPVGAFTAKDFRFKCRVWFLSETKTICPGCSTGCNVTLFQNRNQRNYYRLKPRHNPNVNGHWMCDTGRTMYEHLNLSNRIVAPQLHGKTVSWDKAAEGFASKLKDVTSLQVIITPQLTNEEYSDILKFVAQTKKTVEWYVWRSATEDVEFFDGILHRGDLSPNTFGMNEFLKNEQIQPKILKSLGEIETSENNLQLVFGPEIEFAYTNKPADIPMHNEIEKAFSEKVLESKNLKNMCYFGNNKKINSVHFQFPMLTFAEKNGHYTNYQGTIQKLKANYPVLPTLKPLPELLGSVFHSIGGA
jgi:NADH-quinone oxidoreductase subunit G